MHDQPVHLNLGGASQREHNLAKPGKKCHPKLSGLTGNDAVRPEKAGWQVELVSGPFE